jgi:hypothetical protein
MVKDDRSELIVHRFDMGDVEDPDLYARLAIGEWSNTTAQGAFLRSRRVALAYHTEYGEDGGTWRVRVTARLRGKWATWYTLRFG